MAACTVSCHWSTNPSRRMPSWDGVPWTTKCGCTSYVIDTPTSNCKKEESNALLYALLIEGSYINLARKLQSEGKNFEKPVVLAYAYQAVCGTPIPPEMAVPQVDKRMLGELESMGFPTIRSIRALHYSGNSNLESAINWLLEHESDPEIDQLPLVPREISIECGDTSNEARNNIEETMAHAQERKPEEQTATGRQNRERIRASKDLMEAKWTLEENQRKRMMESRKADQEEEKRARDRIRQRIEDDKAERRRRLGLPQENPGTSVPIITLTKMKPVEPVVTSEQLRDCLRTLKKNHKDDSARVTRAFQILLKIIANMVKNPEEEKFRRIRLSNPVFKDRVGNLQGGVEFLELCGFQKLRADGYLVMPRDKVDMALLNAAGVELASAMANPYFGLLSK